MRLDRQLVRAMTQLLALAAVTAVVPAVGASAAIAAPSLSSGGLVAIPAPVPAPPNDERANAQVIHSLPATINGTVVGATLEAGEGEASCGGATVNSVWYSLRAQGAQRIAVG